MSSIRNVAGAWSLATILALASAPAQAREFGGDLGAAISLTYSIQHETVRPGEAVELLLCIHENGQRSLRRMDTGDAFTFTFGDGLVGECGDVTVYSPTGAFDADDFACVSTPSTVTLVHEGPSVRWNGGEAVCVNVAYQAGLAPSTVRTSYRVRNAGAYAPPAPAAILLSVGDGLGSVGPPGPPGPEGATGATGPAGPAGGGAIGARVFLTSTRGVAPRVSDGAVVVPGLDATVSTADQSRVLVVADLAGDEDDPACPPVAGGARGEASIELDGTTVARRELNPHDGGPSDPLTITWLSPPLGAGTHRVRVLVAADSPTAENRSRCVGSSVNDRFQARLLVLELLP